VLSELPADQASTVVADEIRSSPDVHFPGRYYDTITLWRVWGGVVDRFQVFRATGTVEQVGPVVKGILLSKSEVESLTVEEDGQIILARTWPGLRSSFGERIRVELSQWSEDVVELLTSSESRELFDLGLHKRNLGWIVTGLSNEGLLIEAEPVKWQLRRGSWAPEPVGVVLTIRWNPPCPVLGIREAAMEVVAGN
jgi:hypothetical protein